MIINGGYQIVDLGDNTLEDEGTFTITGIYNQLVKSARKPVYVTGITYNSTEYNDIVGVIAYPYNTTYVVIFDLGGVQVTLTISSADLVTVAIE